MAATHFSGPVVSAAGFSSMTAPPTVTLFDDFIGPALDAGKWTTAKGSNGSALVAAPTGATSGGIILTTGATAVVAESASSLTSGLNWSAATGGGSTPQLQTRGAWVSTSGVGVAGTKYNPGVQAGGLVFEAKVQMASIANFSCFLGFSDALSSTLETPASLSAGTITYTASNAVGFLFDSAATTPLWTAVGVATGTGITLANALTGVAPVAATWNVIRVEINTIGTATFYIDGVLLGSLLLAVTPATALTPIVTAMARTTASKTITVDYIFVQQMRG